MRKRFTELRTFIWWFVILALVSNATHGNDPLLHSITAIRHQDYGGALVDLIFVALYFVIVAAVRHGYHKLRDPKTPTVHESSSK